MTARLTFDGILQFCGRSRMSASSHQRETLTS